MNKKGKIALTAVIAIAVIIVALVSVIYYLPSSPAKTGNLALPSGEPPSVQLKITGDIAAEKTLMISDLTQMPLTTVTYTIKGDTATYIGVTATQLLNSTGASWDAGLVNVISSDGYMNTINTYQAYNSTQYPGSEFILAFTKNGQWITDDVEGPLKFIAPGLTSNYNIKSVSEINLQPWTISVNGEVANRMTLTGSNITNYESKTVTASFAPGGEAQRTSDWTGITLSSILEASGVSSSATKVTVSAVDGYSREFTIEQVQSTGMLIGYKENGVYLSPDGGQPYRLVIPSDEFKWGQNWVRWVSEITVS